MHRYLITAPLIVLVAAFLFGAATSYAPNFQRYITALLSLVIIELATLAAWIASKEDAERRAMPAPPTA